MTLFENHFWELIVSEFTDFQQQKNTKASSPWHRKSARGGDAMNQHQVADRYKGRYTGESEFTYSGELNSKIESIRNGDADVRVCTDADVQHILKNYPIQEIPKDKPKRLSNTGIVIYWDELKDTYMLRKDQDTEHE